MPEAEQWLLQHATKQVLLLGIEAHVCVLQVSRKPRFAFVFASVAVPGGERGAFNKQRNILKAC